LNRTLLNHAITHVDAGAPGTGSWYGLVRLQADVIDKAPALVFIDFAVNDSVDGSGGRANGFHPAAEALVRRLRTALPNAMLVCNILCWPDGYSSMDEDRRLAREKWLELADRYGLKLIRWDTYLETLLPDPYDDTDVEAYFNAAGDVHPNDAGHDAIADNIIASLGTVTGNYSGALPEYYYADETPDFEQTPQPVNGADLAQTGTGWAEDGTAIESSTADDTASYTGIFCSFGLDTNYSTGAGTVAWSVDGGAYTNVDLSAKGVAFGEVSNFARTEHTVTLKVISGTVRINRFLAI
jgi:lysophospholipase L1-like esterase